jgi:hypothetical protein
MTEEITSICASCGASVYRQHIESGIARYQGGKLLCSHCAADFVDEDESAYEPIEFDDGEEDAGSKKEELMSSSRIHSASSIAMGITGAWDDSKFRRALQPQSSGATRCRTFHCKLSEGALEFMINQINEWLDGNDKIVIKFASTTIGPFEGKHTEPNLIITAFY